MSSRIIEWPTRGRRRLLRDINRNLVLNVIKSRGSISRADVARELDLSPATVTEIVRDLVRSELVAEGAAAPSAGGRPGINLSLRPDAGFVVGIKITEHAIIAALTDLDARPRARFLEPLSGRTPEAVVKHLVHAVRTMARAAGTRPEQIIGIGIGLAGLVDGTNGICRYSPFLNWRDVPLRDLLARRLELPVFVENDVNTLAIAEKWFGAGAGIDSFLTVTVGRGVGLGIVLNGHLYRGASGAAGEFGHTIVEPGGPRCVCGKRGCLEALIAEPALIAEYKRRTRRAVTAPRLYELAANNDRVATEVLAAAGARLGRALANLVNILNPARIIVSGEGAAAGEALLGPARAALRANAFGDLGERVDLVVAVAGDEEWARGAASLVVGEVFQPPVYATRPEHSAHLFERTPGRSAATDAGR